MIKNSLLFFLSLCLMLALACNPDFMPLTKVNITKLFPDVLQLSQDLADGPLQFRKNKNGQLLIDDEEKEIMQMLILTESEGQEGESVSYIIIEPDLDTAIGVTPGISTTSLTELGPNMLVPSILKINDSTFLETDIVIHDPLTNLLDSTTVVTGPANLDAPSRSVSTFQVIRDGADPHTHLKTQLRYQQDSVVLFLEKVPPSL